MKFTAQRNVLESNLQNALAQLSHWCKQNGMVINMDKTKTMLITTRQKRNKLNDDSLNIHFNDVNLKTLVNDKMLGVQVDNNLLWTNHITNVSKKMAKNIWLLSKIKEHLSLEHRIRYYKSYIQPHIDYCNIVWGIAAKTSMTKIERIQKRACKIILDYNVDNINQAMNNLKIMTVQERVLYGKPNLCLKFFNETTPI